MTYRSLKIAALLSLAACFLPSVAWSQFPSWRWQMAMASEPQEAITGMGMVTVPAEPSRVRMVVEVLGTGKSLEEAAGQPQRPSRGRQAPTRCPQGRQGLDQDRQPHDVNASCRPTHADDDPATDDEPWTGRREEGKAENVYPHGDLDCRVAPEGGEPRAVAPVGAPTPREGQGGRPGRRPRVSRRSLRKKRRRRRKCRR